MSAARAGGGVPASSDRPLDAVEDTTGQGAGGSQEVVRPRESAPAIPTADRHWLALWCAPWEGCAADWLAEPVAPPGWVGLQARVGEAAMGLGARWWCHHFEMPVLAPALPPPATRALCEGLAWDAASLARTALFLGKVATASRPQFMRDWARGAGAPKGEPIDLPLWRTALALARARPLAAGAPLEQDAGLGLDARALSRTGWVLLRATLHALWPQSWPQLRFRCSARLVRETPALGLTRPPLHLDLADAQQAVRAWRTAMLAGARPQHGA